MHIQGDDPVDGNAQIGPARDDAVTMIDGAFLRVTAETEALQLSQKPLVLSQHGILYARRSPKGQAQEQHQGSAADDHAQRKPELSKLT